ncbi:unnamed protein product [Bathycoccus prasinos]
MSSGNSTALLKISGSPEPGEALRAILIGSIPTFQQRKRASSNDKKRDDDEKNHPQRSTFSTIEEEEEEDKEEEEEEEALVLEFQWFRTTKGDESEENLAIVGATAPIYLVRKVDVGCHIKAVATLRSQSREGIVLATFTGELEGEIKDGDLHRGKKKVKKGGQAFLASISSPSEKKALEDSSSSSRTTTTTRTATATPPTTNDFSSGKSSAVDASMDRTMSNSADATTKTTSKTTKASSDETLLKKKRDYDDYIDELLYDSNDSSQEDDYGDSSTYVDVLQKLKAYARLRIRHMGHFSKLLSFAAFVTLYCAMLYLQTEPVLSYEVTSSVSGLLKPRIKQTQDIYYMYDWLSESVVDSIWTDIPCGDGICQAPYEFPAFGRFGCKADCGVAINLISLVIHIQTKFGNSPALSALELMSQVTWNLCLQDPGRVANDLPDLCWYEKDQKFTEVNTNTLIRLNVIIGNWHFRLRGDHLGLVAGKIYRLEENGDLVLTPTVPLWLTCTKNSLFKNVKARISKTTSSNSEGRLSSRISKSDFMSADESVRAAPRRQLETRSSSLDSTFDERSGAQNATRPRSSSYDENENDELFIQQGTTKIEKKKKMMMMTDRETRDVIAENIARKREGKRMMDEKKNEENFASSLSKSSREVTNSNFHDAISECLSMNEASHREDGLCENGIFGAMPDWDTRLVTNMVSAFRDRSDFNADISRWDVSQVTDMESMFASSSNFNRDISRWDTSKVKDMRWMFHNATNFDQNIYNWSGYAATSPQSKIFAGADAFNEKFACIVKNQVSSCKISSKTRDANLLEKKMNSSERPSTSTNKQQGRELLHYRGVYNGDIHLNTGEFDCPFETVLG